MTKLFSAPPMSHVGLRVPDIDSAVSWYRDVLGFVLLEGPYTFDRPTAPTLLTTIYGDQWDQIRQAHLASGSGAGVELFEFSGAPANNGGTWKPGLVPEMGPYHFCLTASQIDDVAARVEAAGGRRRTPTAQPAKGGYRMTYCEDPFGNAVELNDRSYEQAHANRGGARS